MQLDTQRFGTVTYDAQDEIGFPDGLLDDAKDTRWLLLADQQHPALYWLQSVSHPDRSFAVCAVSSDIAKQGIRLHRTRQLPDWVARTPVVALARLVRTSDDEVGIALSKPLLINPRTREATQAAASVDQTLQREWSDKVAPLRECA